MKVREKVKSDHYLRIENGPLLQTILGEEALPVITYFRLLRKE